MPQDVQRGFCPTDNRDFSPEQVELLQQVQGDLVYLLDRGYDMERSVTFIGNRFQLSNRQRTAVTRASASRQILTARKEKQVACCESGSLAGKTVYVDGFNLIITLEAALSAETTLLRCMDGTVRDLCGLRGTYKVIESTGKALEMVTAAFLRRNVGKAVFYLDAPVSNSGRLRGAISAAMEAAGVSAEVIMVPNADAELWGKENVVSSDGIILDRCSSWINLAEEIISELMPYRKSVKLSMR